MAESVSSGDLGDRAVGCRREQLLAGRSKTHPVQIVEWCEAQEDVEMLAKRSIGHPADADQVGYCDLLAHMRSHVSDGHLDVSGDHDTAAY